MKKDYIPELGFCQALAAMNSRPSCSRFAWLRRMGGVVGGLLLMLCASFVGMAQPTSLGGFGNIVVQEYDGDYSSGLSGNANVAPRQAVAQAFFNEYQDLYDFIVVFTNFDFPMPTPSVNAFYVPIRNDVQGIGLELFDSSDEFGSDGRLQGYIDMGNALEMASHPIEAEFEQTLYLLAHEILHRWSAYVHFRDGNGDLRDDLVSLDLDEGSAHWSFLTDSDGSVVYGNDWRANGDGTFSSVMTDRIFSPLDLYLMGFLDSSEVPPTLLIENSDIDPDDRPRVGARISGTTLSVPIESIIAAEGPRIPSAAEAQKEFRVAFVYLTRPGTFSNDQLARLEAIRSEWITRFAVMTDGIGRMEVDALPIGGLPTNPGIDPPNVTARTAAPSLDEGVDWLVAEQSGEGNWLDSSLTAERDTALGLLATGNFPSAALAHANGLTWLQGAESSNHVYLALKIDALLEAGIAVEDLVDNLVGGQNPDGGWGTREGYVSNGMDSAFALRALARSQLASAGVVFSAVSYLTSQQLPDGSWGIGALGSIEATAQALGALHLLRDAFDVTNEIDQGIAWLLGHQSGLGGFGVGQASLLETAVALNVLKELEADPAVVNAALNFLLDRQAEDGSWNGSRQQSALAIRAIWNTTRAPDLSVSPVEVSATPNPVITLPTDITIEATIRNVGMADVAQAKVALYEGDVNPENLLGEQDVALAGGSSVQAVFQATVQSGGQRLYRVVVDPEGGIEESNEANNTALQLVTPQLSYDFFVSDVSTSINPAAFRSDVTVFATLENRGTQDAFNVPVTFRVDGDEVATLSVDLPAGGAITRSIAWAAEQVGVDLPITVEVDGANSFAELDEGNNVGNDVITVNEPALPNLAIRHQDITVNPSPASQGGAASISAVVVNQTSQLVSDVEVVAYDGAPDQGGQLIGTQTVASIAGGSQANLTFDWFAIASFGTRVVYLEVDPNGLIAELDEADNDAFVTLDVLSLPDLSISSGSILLDPASPRSGDLVSIQVTVRNLGDQVALGVPVEAFANGTSLGAQNLASIAGQGQEGVIFAFDTTGISEPQVIRVLVDPASALVEASRDNNEATSAMSLQDSEFFVTDPYISPNGDAIKDTTRVFFRTESVTDLVVRFIDREGATVRRFEGDGLSDVLAGSVLWDGKDGQDRIVADGPYEVAIEDSAGNRLRTLEVVVDNNRSPLVDAVGTEFLTSNSLFTTEGSDYVWDWSWYPDGSGILLRNSLRSYDDPPEDESIPVGLFRLSPGGEPIPLGDATWRQFSYGAGGFHYKQRGWVSPDSSKVLYSAILEPHTFQPSADSELWVSGASGEGLSLLDSQSGRWVYQAVWDSQSDYVAYTGQQPQGNGFTYNLRMIRSDGSGGVEVESEGSIRSFSWSPDGTQLAYVKDSTTVRLSDRLGVTQDLFEAPATIQSLQWLTSNRLVLHYTDWSVSQTEIVVIDAQGVAPPNVVTAFGSDFFSTEILPSPDGLSFAVTSQEQDGNGLNVPLQVYSLVGDELFAQTFSFGSINGTCTGYTSLPVWTADGSRVALIGGAHGSAELGGSCGGEEDTLYVVTVPSGSLHVQPINGVPSGVERIELASWLGDGVTLIGDGVNTSGGIPGLLAISSAGGQASVLDSNRALRPKLSPNQNEIGFERLGDFGEPSTIETMSSLLNLRAELAAAPEGASIKLLGIAQDLHFDRYVLEYATLDQPANWTLIRAPSESPVVNDVFANWIPPQAGTYLVRLSVSDLAGNLVDRQIRVSTGLSSSITGLQTDLEFISPNGDGVNDEVTVTYRAVEPVNLEFSVLDSEGNIVQTLVNNHAVSEDGSVIWDGTDFAGDPVIDGSYLIRVFQFELPIEVDSTAPQVDLVISPPAQFSSLQLDGTDVLDIVSEMEGRARDSNLDRWFVEFGEGANPQAWTSFRSGNGALGPDFGGNELIERFSTYGIEPLVDRRFRITAVDRAGNQSTQITGLVPESLIFYSWDQVFDVSDASIFQPGGAVDVEVLEIIRRPIDQFVVQTRDLGGGPWSDLDAVTVGQTGVAAFRWDTSALAGVSFPLELRFKAIDDLGGVHLSNAAEMDGFFLATPSCDVLGFNSFADLNDIQLQVKSTGGQIDPSYFEWTPLAVTFETALGGTGIPVGEFSVGFPSSFLPFPGGEYQLRIIGLRASGERLVSQTVLLRSVECPLHAFDIEYVEAEECDEVAPGIANLSWFGMKISEADFRASSLIYSIVRDGVEEAVLSFDPIGSETLELVTFVADGFQESALMLAAQIDLNQFPEGQYPMRARFNLRSGGDLPFTVTGDNLAELPALIVDRTPPEAEISFPFAFESVCPQTLSDGRLGLEVQGRATDLYGVKRYELSHPASIHPIVTSEARHGVLGSFPVGALGGELQLGLRVVDLAGNVSCVEMPFDISDLLEMDSMTVSPPEFSPDGDGLEEETTLMFDLSNPTTADIGVYDLIRQTDGSFQLGTIQVRALVSQEYFEMGPHQVLWDGRDDGGALVADGSYALRFQAGSDCGTLDEWVRVTKTNTVSDEAPPEVHLVSPAPNSLHGFGRDTILVRGSVVEPNLDNFVLRFGEGNAPSAWTDLRVSTSLPAEAELFEWAVGLGQGIEDGVYTLSLLATDLGGRTDEARVVVLVDNLPPTVSMNSPESGAYVVGPSPIVGTASDFTIANYRVEYAPGPCDSASQWSVIADGVEAVDGVGLLGHWSVLPNDGDYCLRLVGTDALGNRAEVLQAVTVDTTAPEVPFLRAVVANGVDAQLDLEPSASADVAGYQFYRNGERLNTDLVLGTSFVSFDQEDGEYVFTATAVDHAGLESSPSNPVALSFDLIGPEVSLVSPVDGGLVSGEVRVRGKAFSADDFREYRLDVGPGASPLSYDPVASSPLPVAFGELGRWDTLGLPEGEAYTLRLEAEDRAGNVSTSTILVTVDNVAPAPPVLVSAVATDSDVDVVWQSNTETDLAGYLLFRNGQLVNATGIVLTDVTPFLLNDPAYFDAELADGTYQYNVVAVDLAGNVSGSSNSIAVQIDLVPPQAVIVDSEDGATFSATIEVRAESLDNDIASIQFQYLGELDVEFQDLGQPLSVPPYVVSLDPDALGIGLGGVTLRAVATDQGGQTDPAPSEIYLERIDAGPLPPTDLVAQVYADEVTLTWEPALVPVAGYHVYLIEDGDTQQVTGAAIPETEFSFQVADNHYEAEVVSVDDEGNEGDPSERVAFRVYAPTLIQPDSPTGAPEIVLSGTDAAADGAVEIFGDLGGGPFSIGTTQAGPIGDFTALVELEIGFNQFHVQVTDTEGNVSRESDPVFVERLDGGPEPPTDLVATANGDQVELAWSDSVSPNVVGYNVYRQEGVDWELISLDLVEETTFIDFGLGDGTFTYRVTSVDTSFNEGLPSEEISVTVGVLSAVVPTLFLPGDSVGCFPFGEESVVLRGFGGAGLTMELELNGAVVASVISSGDSNLESTAIDFFGEGSALSADGRWFAYGFDGSLQLLDVTTGNSVSIAQDVYPDETSLSWSEAGDLLAFVVEGEIGARIDVYDRMGQSTAPMSPPPLDVYQRRPLFLEGSRLAYIRTAEDTGVSDLWLTSLETGSEENLSQLGIEFVDLITISSDENYLTVFEDPTLSIQPRIAGSPFTLQTEFWWGSDFPTWSSDNSRLTFLNGVAGEEGLFVYHADSQELVQLTGTNDIQRKRWYPDSQHVLYVTQEVDGASLWLQNIDSAQEPTILQEGLFDYVDFYVTDDGRIGYSEPGQLHLIDPAGRFEFPSVALVSGQNQFQVVSRDGQGNELARSEIYCLQHDVGPIPDLEVTVEDFTVSPESPLEGTQVGVAVAIRNLGLGSVSSVPVTLHAVTSQNSTVLLRSTVVDSISAGGDGVVTGVFDTSGLSGLNYVIATVDPDGLIAESDDTNNRAFVPLTVQGFAGVSMTSTLNGDSFQQRETVSVVVRVENLNDEIRGNLRTDVLDGNGALVANLPIQAVVLPYGTVSEFTFGWNSGTTLPGGYEVRTELTQSGNSEALSNVPFEIIPRLDLACSLHTEREVFGPEESVTVLFDVANLDNTYVIPQLDARLTLLDENGGEVFADDRMVQGLQPESTVAFTGVWNTGLSLPGEYQLAVEWRIDGQLICESRTTVQIEGRPLLSGEVNVDPPVVPYGDPFEIETLLANQGTADADGIEVILEVVDSETQTLLDTSTELTSVPAGSAVSRLTNRSSLDFGLGVFNVNLHQSGSSQPIATGTFAVLDGRGPDLTLVSPSANVFLGQTVPIEVLATDDVSLIDWVEYRIDSGDWRLMVGNEVEGGFTVEWTPELEDLGSHVLDFRASDSEGNLSALLSVPFEVVVDLEAREDLYELVEDQSLFVGAPGVLSNDGLGAEGRVVNVATEPANGSVTLFDDGSFSYQPDPNFSGEDRFSYQNIYQTQTSAPAEVVLNVIPVNDPPILEAQPIAVATIGQPYQFILQASDPDGDPLDYTLVNTPSWLAFDSGTGAFSGTPDVGDEGTNFEVSIRVSDGQLTTSLEPFDITVECQLISVPNVTGLTELEAETLILGSGFAVFKSYQVTGDPKGEVLQQEPAAGESGCEASVVRLIISANNRPIAFAGDDQTELPLLPVSLDGTRSADLDADPLTYVWSLVEKPQGSVANLSDPTAVDPILAVDSEGTYEVELVVFDGTESSLIDVVVFDVQAGGDFGDAPDTYGTSLAADGARHGDVPGPILGVLKDVEDDGNPSAAANADDLLVTDDEDGVEFLPANGFEIGGVNNEVQVTISHSVPDSTDSADYEVWIDWNQDGDFDDSGELVSVGTLGQGVHSLPVLVPAAILPGATYARVRVAAVGDGLSSPRGFVATGEVEDYPVYLVTPPDPCIALISLSEEEIPEDGSIQFNGRASSGTKAGLGTGLDFDGLDDYVNVDSPFVDFGTELTVELWVNPGGAFSVAQATPGGDAGVGDVWSLSVGSDGIVQFEVVGDAGEIRTVASAPIWGWTHIGGVVDSTGVRLLVDGVLQDSALPLVGNLRHNAGAVLEMGRDPRQPDQMSQGLLDEVRIWRVARPASELIANAGHELKGNESGLVGYWRFNEGTDVIARDDSPQGADAALNQMDPVADWVAGAPVKKVASILSFTWDFGDGSDVQVGDLVTHTYGEPGDYTATLVVDDGSCTHEATAAIRVINVNDPPIAACQPLEVVADPALCVATVAGEEVGQGSTDPDGDPLTFLLEPPGPYGEGEHLVQLTVTDPDGATDTCETLITVVDRTSPLITLIGDSPQIIECPSPYLELGATALDNCDQTLGVVIVDASGLDTSTPGSYVVTYNISDASGNAAVEVIRIVNVVDTTPPVITLIGDNPQIIECPNPYVELGATASDDCDQALGAVVVDASGVDTTIPGSYVVTYNIGDASGNAAVEVIRTVNVVDTTPPVITLLGDNPQLIECPNPYVELGATALDDCDQSLGAVVVDTSAVDTTTPGSYVVTYNISDASGNAAVEVIRTVNVADTTPPVITLIGDNPQLIECPSPYVELGATALDDCDQTLGAVVVDASGVDTSTQGSYVVTYNISDSSGNAAVEMTRTVNVVDTTPPVITLIGDNPQIIECPSPYVELGATASDDCDQALGAVVVDASAVDTSTPGSYSVTYNISDSSGNAAVEVIRTVNVVDTTPPVITLIGDNPQIIECPNPYVELGATASDDCDQALGAVVVDASGVDTTTPGSYVVTYKISDSSGNAAVEMTRTVNVVDTTPPVITLIGDNPQLIECPSPYVELGATALDDCDQALGSVVVDASGVDTATPGSYIVTYNISDASGNAAVEVIRTVNVVDTTPPVITLLGDNPQIIECPSPYVEFGATALDDCDQALGSVVVDASGVDTTTPGSYVVTYNISDASGNAAVEMIRTVNVVDTTPPVITLLGDNPQIIECPNPYVELGATALDDCDQTLGAVVVDASSVDTSTPGSYVVAYNISDSSGNAAVEVIRTVNVVDTTPPVITLIGDNPQILECPSPYVEMGATALDDCDQALGAVVVDASAVDTSTPGSYVVAYNISDASGNAAVEVIRTVNVVDTTPPVITLLGDNPQLIECPSPYLELGATASDDCDQALGAVIVDASAVDTRYASKLSPPSQDVRIR